MKDLTLFHVITLRVVDSPVNAKETHLELTVPKPAQMAMIMLRRLNLMLLEMAVNVQDRILNLNSQLLVNANQIMMELLVIIILLAPLQIPKLVTIMNPAYATKEILPPTMLVLETMLLVNLNGVQKDHATWNAQLLKVGPIVHALIVPITRLLTMMELPVYALQLVMLRLLVNAQVPITPLQQLLTNKHVKMNVQMTVILFMPTRMVLQPVLVLTLMIKKHFGMLALILLLVLSAPKTVYVMELSFPVVLVTTTTIHQLKLVSLLAPHQRYGQALNANAPLIKKSMVTIALPVT